MKPISPNRKFIPTENLKFEFRTEDYDLLNHTSLYLRSTIDGTGGQNASPVASSPTPSRFAAFRSA